MTDLNIVVDMDKKCAECRKKGACENGICLSCTAKAMRGEMMRSSVGTAVQNRFTEYKERKERMRE
jgi:hypothetical protein